MGFRLYPVHVCTVIAEGIRGRRGPGMQPAAPDRKRSGRNTHENENEQRHGGGGANASKKLMAAIAVLAVMFAAFAVVFVSDDSYAANETKTSKDGYVSVSESDSLKVSVSGNKFVFSGYADAGKIGTTAFTKDDFGTDSKYTIFAGVQFTMNGLPSKSVQVTQKNTALSLYPEDEFIKPNSNAANGTWVKVSPTDGNEVDRQNDPNYAFLIPKDSSIVEITLKTMDSSKKYTQVLGTYVFDFSKVSTKITLGDTELTGKNWSYNNSTLSLTNYDGREIFTASKNLNVELSGKNTINAYGVADKADGSGDAAIKVTGSATLSIKAKADGDSLNLNLSTGLFGLWANGLTLGEESGKKVTFTSIGGNRALYSGAGMTIQSATVDVTASEKTIRSNNDLVIKNSSVTAKLDGTGQQNDADKADAEKDLDQMLVGIAVGHANKESSKNVYGDVTITDSNVTTEGIHIFAYDENKKKLDVESKSDVTVDGDAKITAVNMNGGKVTFNGKLTGEYNDADKAYGTTTFTGETGTVVLGAKVDLNKITKGENCKAGFTIDPSAMEEMNVGGTTTGKDNDTEYPINQIVTVNGSWTLAPGANITILGQFILPEDATLTIQNGAKLTLANGSVSKLDGKVVIEEGDSNADDAKNKVPGTLNANGQVSVTGTVQSYGNIVVGGELSIEADAVVSVEDTGSILTAAGSKLTVKESGTLEIRGGFTNGSVGLAVYNYGLVTIDSEAAAQKSSTIYQMASGAVVDVVSYTVNAKDSSAEIALVITDSELAPAKDSKTTIGEKEKANEIKISASADIQDGATAPQKAASLITVSGVRIVENVVSKTSDPKDESFVKIGTKYYSATADVSGNVAASAQYTGSDSVTVSVKGATVSFTGGTGIVVSDGAVLTVGAKVTVTNAGVMNVAGKVESVINGDSGNATFTNTDGTVTVSGNGSVKSNKALDGTVNATNYQTTEATKPIQNYVTLDAALAMVNADGNAVKQLNALGANKVTASAKLPADVTLKQDNADENVITIGEKAGDDVTLTIAKGAVIKNNGKINVNGTLYAEDKTNVKGTNIISDVYSEQVDEKGKAVRNGWAQWTNLVNALNGAEAGQTINISKDKTAGDVEISADAEIKAGVTLVVPDDTATLLLKNGVTLTVSGKLVTEQAIKAENSFDVEARNVADAKDNSSAVVVKGVFASSSVEIKYGYVAPVPDAEKKYTIAQANTAGAPIAGAYYATKDYNYVVSPLSVAIASIADITSEITVKGAVAEGDIAFAATEDVKKIVVENKTLENPSKTVTSLTVASLTLSEGAAVSGGIFNGSVVVGANTVVLKGATGLSAAEKDGKLVLDGTLTVNVKDGSFQVSAGTAVANGLTIKTGENGKAVVASGATLEAGKAGIANIDALTVEGTLSVPATYNATIGTLVVYGAVSVTAATSEKTAGTLTVTDLFVGMTSDDYTAKTAAAASVSGTVKINGIAYVLNGSALDADAQKSVDDLENSTVFHVNGSVWFTAYANGDKTVTVSKAPITDAILTGWAATEGGKAIDNNFVVTIGGDNKDVYALIKTDIYDIVIKADEGIADVYLNGQAMYYGAVSDGKSGYYYAYTATVSAGDYKVTYTLKNGWSGDAKLSGDNVTGMSLKATGDAGQKVYQLTGIEKSGYVEPSEPSDDKDDGMTITDYLLIVLVVLIVILAVIVALRLMRS